MLNQITKDIYHLFSHKQLDKYLQAIRVSNIVLSTNSS